jgi:AraC-like DNA-binding protein
VHHLELTAPEELKDYIRGFWYLERDFGNAPSAFEVLPDGNAEIIFYFGDTLKLNQGDHHEDLPSPFIVGLLGKTIHFYAKNSLKIMGVKCYPWAVFDMLGLVPVKANVITYAAHPISALQNNLSFLLSGGSVEEALKMLRDWFVCHIAGTAKNLLLNKAGQAILQASGTSPVSGIAEAAHSTVRTLERKFKASSGHTIKDVSGLIRFEQARDILWCTPETSISALAYALGYADQSHLNREFKRYCGITAATFARQAKTRKEAFGDDFVAIILSS